MATGPEAPNDDAATHVASHEASHGAPGSHARWNEIAAALREDGNWHARRKRLMTLLAGLEVAVAVQGRGTDPGAPLDLAETRGRFIDRVPPFLAFLLDRIGEAEVTSAEQAAFYLLSAREEHRKAADAWLRGDPKRLKALRRLVKADRRYRRILDDSRAHLP